LILLAERAVIPDGLEERVSALAVAGARGAAQLWVQALLSVQREAEVLDELRE
jgi:hypothetical protein